MMVMADVEPPQSAIPRAPAVDGEIIDPPRTTEPVIPFSQATNKIPPSVETRIDVALQEAEAEEIEAEIKAERD